MPSSGAVISRSYCRSKWRAAGAVDTPTTPTDLLTAAAAGGGSGGAERGRLGVARSAAAAVAARFARAGSAVLGSTNELNVPPERSNP